MNIQLLLCTILVINYNPELLFLLVLYFISYNKLLFI